MPQRMILGLDPATQVTGWAVITDQAEHVASGIIPGGHKKISQRINQNIKEIERIIEEYNVTDIACEDIFIGTNRKTGIQLARLNGALMTLAVRKNIPFHLIHNQTIKAVFAGTGRATKEDVIKAVNARYPNVELQTSDHADAIAAACTYLTNPERAISA